MSEHALDDRQVADDAEQLVRAESTCVPIDALAHAPRDVADGYRIQAAVHRLGAGRLVGWKAGCTAGAAQRMLHIDRPLFGRYTDDEIVASPVTLSLDEFATPPHIEVEIGLRMVQEVAEPPDDPFDLVGSVEAFGAIEVVSSRLAGFPLLGAAELAADDVVGARMIVGPTLALVPDRVRLLDATTVVLDIGGERVAEGTGAEALGHPLHVLHALAVHAQAAGEALRVGDLVLTGTCTGLHRARPGEDHVGRVGGVEVLVRFDRPR